MSTPRTRKDELVKPKRDPAKLLPPQNVADCSGHCCLYGCSAGGFGRAGCHSPAAIALEHHFMGEKPLSLCIINILLEVKKI